MSYVFLFATSGNPNPKVFACVDIGAHIQEVPGSHLEHHKAIYLLASREGSWPRAASFFEPPLHFLLQKWAELLHQALQPGQRLGFFFFFLTKQHFPPRSHEVPWGSLVLGQDLLQTACECGPLHGIVWVASLYFSCGFFMPLTLLLLVLQILAH